MSIRNLQIVFNASLCALSLSGAAWGQAPTQGVAPPQAPGPGVARWAAPEPAAAPPAPRVAAPPTGAAPVPPGYMLVPVPDPSPTTRYDVQYPQARGVLPPGMDLPYEDGDPIPQGYRLRKQPRRGLVIAGSVVTGVLWTFSVAGAVIFDFDNKSGFLLVPGIGPWLMLLSGGASDHCQALTATDYATRDACNNSALRAVITVDGLGQTAGAVMFIAGLAFPRKRLVRSDVTFGLVPANLGPDGYGVGAAGTF